MNRLTPDMMLRAYAYGIFPMAEGRSDPAVHWIEPERVTCNACIRKESCEYAFDPYNLDGDCLWEK